MNIITSGMHIGAAFYTGKFALNSSNILKLRVRDYTVNPGPGRRENGTKSGQEYLEKIVLPSYHDAKRDHKVLFIDMDGTAGYGPSFVRELFLGLIRETGDKELRNHMEVVLTEDPIMFKSIKEWVDKAVA